MSKLAVIGLVFGGIILLVVIYFLFSSQSAKAKALELAELAKVKAEEAKIALANRTPAQIAADAKADADLKKAAAELKAQGLRDRREAAQEIIDGIKKDKSDFIAAMEADPKYTFMYTDDIRYTQKAGTIGINVAPPAGFTSPSVSKISIGYNWTRGKYDSALIWFNEKINTAQVEYNKIK